MTPRFIEHLAAGHSQHIVFYGTSLTEAGTWPVHLMDRLRHAFGDRVTSINTAKSGEHSVWGLANFQERVIDQRPDVLFLEFATNDAVTRFDISLETSGQNLRTIIDRVRSHHPHCEVIVQTMNPIIDRPPGHAGHRGELDAYVALWRDTALLLGLPVIEHYPAWKHLLMTDEATFRRVVPDGLHPNDEGYRLIVLPTLCSALSLADA